MDKAPDAFRTISEVSDDLDIPQHVLRFWETRFAQIKPMKRSGGRRYYRPDDVELLRGIRRLLYGEGYTIRGVQRILREHGIKAVQGLDGRRTLQPASFAEPSFGDGDENREFQNGEPDGGAYGGDASDGIDDDIDDEALGHAAGRLDIGIDRHDRIPDKRAGPVFDGAPRSPDPVISQPVVKPVVAKSPEQPGPSLPGAEAYAPPNIRKAARPLDRGKLQTVLDDLISARDLIDRVLKDD